MVNQADLDSSLSVPCRHCAALLQKRERFCPFCGEDQFDSDGAVDGRSAVEPERSTSAGGGNLVPTSAATEEANSEIGLARPALRQQEVLEGGGSGRRAGRYALPNRWVIGIVAALVLLVLALVHDTYLDKQSEADKLRQFQANVEQVQSALSRGDLSAAKRVLDVLDAERADDPGVKELRQAFDRQAQEQAAKREHLEDATLKASQALGLGEPAAPPAPTPLPPEAPMVAIPAPGIGVADPQVKECDEALAALALCSRR
jgi:RNA polymerase subunit RPABC4/transcription elongation factor Spt4